MARVTVNESIESDIETGFQQTINSFLAGEANRAIKRGAYANTNAFLTSKIKVAVQIAINMTQRKYPLAKSRDEGRRPFPGEPHLEDSWTYTKATDINSGASLINTRPRAAMLVFGFDSPSYYPASKGRPYAFPKAGLDQRKMTDPKNMQVRVKPFTRPVPADQHSVSPGEGIPQMAIRRAFQSGRRV